MSARGREGGGYEILQQSVAEDLQDSVVIFKVELPFQSGCEISGITSKFCSDCVDTIAGHVAATG